MTPLTTRNAQAMAAAAAAVSAAAARVNEARDAYTIAVAAYESARSHAALAEQNAASLRQQADDAEALSTAVKRLLIVVLRQRLHPSPSFSDVDAVLGHATTETLLGALGSVERIKSLIADTEAITAIAVRYNDRAVQLRAQADRAAQVGVTTLVDELQAIVTTASTTLATAEDTLQQLQVASLASSGTQIVLPVDHGQLSDVGWALPTSGTISGGYGARPDKPLPSSGDFHYGLDVAAACGTPIYAATSGTVVEVGALGGYGYWVKLDHGSGVETGYAHLPSDGVAVTLGQVVVAGQPIGVVGTTGSSTGCHLHFEVRLDGSRIDPLQFLAARGVAVTVDPVPAPNPADPATVETPAGIAAY
ncbi:M23 family metallopeptidase [Salinibacterium sp. ZJ454]|uniref:M23 family metallopeptidase n=1 Tax=Salinibacterium sp. ZJ454 TaxID=2708339 RepID=UPI001AB02335|nr:M23 family metallopeptidase [Salinibacterium sp. ZJ454]